jgi:hypothetical protein
VTKAQVRRASVFWSLVAGVNAAAAAGVVDAHPRFGPWVAGACAFVAAVFLGSLDVRLRREEDWLVAALSPEVARQLDRLARLAELGGRVRVVARALALFDYVYRHHAEGHTLILRDPDGKDFAVVLDP